MAAKGTVLLIGGTGFLGKLVGRHLTEVGYAINCVALEAPTDFIALGYPCRYIQWDGESLLPDHALKGQDGESPVTAVINLAGDPLSSDRWLSRKRKAILESRIRSVEVAVDAAERCRAATLIQGSSIDYYGNTHGGEVDEASDVGTGFWPETVARWERAASTLGPDTRLVVLRMGEVYSIHGGSFRSRLLPYCFRIGAPMIRSDHYIGWIHEDDLKYIVQKAIEDSRYEGTINATSPEPCSLKALHDEFRRYYIRFLRVPVPLWLKRLVFGLEMEKTAISQRPLPKKLSGLGFQFTFPKIDGALANLLDKSAADCFYFTRHQWVPAPPEDVWDFFAHAKNWEKINPKSFRLELKDASTKVAREGGEFEFKLHFANVLPSNWRLRHTYLERPHLIQGLVQEGSMSMLELTQRFTEVAGGTRIEDVMRFQFHQGYIGILPAHYVAERINAMIFDHRQTVIRDVFNEAQEADQQIAG